MTIEKRYCFNHGQRPAIGICVITQKPICGECSTRYDGVNYSKEGLEILHRQRGEGNKRSARVMAVLVWLMSPVLLYLLYLSYQVTAVMLANVLHQDL